MRVVKTSRANFNGDRGGHRMEDGMAPQGSTTRRRKTRDGRNCFPGCPAANQVNEALAQG